VSEATGGEHDEPDDVYLIGRQRHNAQIHLEAYDPSWPVLYEREAARVRGQLGETVVRLEHIGSTSVPGLRAKPIIDMLLVVAEPAAERDYVRPLESVGYVLKIREPDWHEHRLLKGPDTDINLHVHPPTSAEVNRCLLFRDWLRANEDDRRLYEDTKLELAARRWTYVQDYADAKSDVVEEILARATAATEGDLIG
jgi:GrpB-like predicted nucleotidyltransferase (UPF0157 family)